MVSPTGRKTAKQAAQTGRITAFPTVFRSLRETDADLTDILDAIADGVIVRNSNRKMLYANEAAARLLGYGSTAAIMSTSNEEFDTRFEFADEHGLPVDLPDLPSRQALRGIPSPEITLRFRNRVTGSTGWALVKSRPVLDGRGDVRLTVTIIHDITLLKQTESDLRQARDELERTTAERTGKLFEANAVLHERLAQQDHDSAGFKVKLRRLFTRGDGVAADEEATRADLAQMRITFNDTAARELGLPIAAIRALTTTAKSTETNSEAHRQAIEAINDEADLLDSMVRDLETATSCEREESSFALQSVNLKDVLAETKCFAATLTGDHPIMVAHPC